MRRAQKHLRMLNMSNLDLYGIQQQKTTSGSMLVGQEQEP